MNTFYLNYMVSSNVIISQLAFWALGIPANKWASANSPEAHKPAERHKTPKNGFWHRKS